MHERNAFLTLTYDDEHLPADLSLNREHYDLFLKRLRERLRPLKIRHFMGGEYGEKYSRPHYHSIIFGWYPDDAQYWKTTEAGHKIYNSKFIQEVWPYGRVDIGAVTQQSIAYIARYTLKKAGSEKRREILDVTTGEIIDRENEYGQMSLKPGIGEAWVKKYPGDVFNHDRINTEGRLTPLPKYYDVLLGRIAPLLLAEHKATRAARADSKYQRLEETADNKFQDLRRLKVHEAVKLASLKLLKRD